MKAVYGPEWHGSIWPTTCDGLCEQCGIPVEQGDGVYVSIIGRYKKYSGIWCPKCYMHERDSIMRCE